MTESNGIANSLLKCNLSSENKQAPEFFGAFIIPFENSRKQVFAILRVAQVKVGLLKASLSCADLLSTSMTRGATCSPPSIQPIIAILLQLFKKLYLCAMHGIRHTLLRKAASAFLMGLLFSIHAIKLLHTHPHESVPIDSTAKNDQVSFLKVALDSCSICQFDFTREASLPDTDIGIRPLLIFSVFNSGLDTCSYSEPRFYFFHRGPPTA